MQGSILQNRVLLQEDKMKDRRYNISEAIEVMVNFRVYYVFLDSEIVVQEIINKKGKAIIRRVTSRNIETSAIIRASDKYYSKDKA